MAEIAKWWDAVWNPWRGCHPVRPKCKACYNRQADSWFARAGRDPNTVERASRKTFRAPLDYPPGTAVAVCLLSDFFLEEADPWRNAALDVMFWAIRNGVGPFIIPTSRPARMADALNGALDPSSNFWDSIWFLASIADQADADELLPELLKVPAGHLGVSHEPATGAVDWRPYLTGFMHLGKPGGMPPLAPVTIKRRLEWIVTGGANHVAEWPLDLNAARLDRNQAVAAGISFFYKGAPRHLTHPQPPILDGRAWREGPGRAPIPS